MRNENLINEYRKLIKSEEIKFDPVQEAVIYELEKLAQKLVKPTHRRFFFRRTSPKQIQGIYLWGDVGRGKTMLMDLFYNVIPLSNKRRVHYHKFMQEFHREINLARISGSNDLDPLEKIVSRISGEVKLLCFDEFQVTDIGDAMILGRLFKEFFSWGIVPVITSNRAPDSLYDGGVNRDRFIPFIKIVKSQMSVIELDGGNDYRQLFLRENELYLTPLNTSTSQKMKEAFLQLTGGGELEPVELSIMGRKLIVPKASKGVAWMTFDDLCRKAIGAAEYIALSEEFHTFLIEEVPCMGPDQRNEAKRFISLIDILYESRASIILSAQVPPSKLYTDGNGKFEFKRTASRLLEMQSKEYLISK
tara:strand:+ start:25569 stop:26654 length:1086 start_codon:yes stop_codon:yes gene_type:complete